MPLLTYDSRLELASLLTSVAADNISKLKAPLKKDCKTMKLKLHHYLQAGFPDLRAYGVYMVFIAELKNYLYLP